VYSFPNGDQYLGEYEDDIPQVMQWRCGHSGITLYIKMRLMLGDTELTAGVYSVYVLHTASLLDYSCRTDPREHA
jgi:hypothetical protein